MTDIKFEEEQQYQPAYTQTEKEPYMIRLVLSTGIVSTHKAANYVLLGVAALAIILAFIVPAIINSSPKVTSGQQRPLLAPGIIPPTVNR